MRILLDVLSFDVKIMKGSLSKWNLINYEAWIMRINDRVTDKIFTSWGHQGLGKEDWVEKKKMSGKGDCSSWGRKGQAKMSAVSQKGPGGSGFRRGVKRWDKGKRCT